MISEHFLRCSLIFAILEVSDSESTIILVDSGSFESCVSSFCAVISVFSEILLFLLLKKLKIFWE